jgi:23S rRNA pseudouridine2605 synthase
MPKSTTTPGAKGTGDNARGAAEQDGIRLQKVLAAAGVGSRRQSEELIEAGRVAVNGKVVRVQGMRVDPQQAVVTVDGNRIVTRSGMVYLALNKPTGMLSAMSDDRGRPTVGDLIAGKAITEGERLFHVGRLDADTEGLLLLTNDGDLTHKLTHPSFEVHKTYLAEVKGPIARDVGRTLRAGVPIDGRTVSVHSFRVVGNSEARVMLEIVLHEGRNHIVRRLLEDVGYPVLRLVRTQIGPVVLGSLRAGRIRPLNSQEIAGLFSLVER